MTPHVEELVKELRDARLRASAGTMEEAERHIRAALRLFDAAPRGSLPPAVRTKFGYYRNHRARFVLRAVEAETGNH